MVVGRQNVKKLPEKSSPVQDVGGESRQRVVGEVVMGAHKLATASSRLWGSTRMRMVQLDQFEKYDRGGSIPAPDTEEGTSHQS